MSDLGLALAPLAAAFQDLGVPFRLGGSVASSLHGVPRSTLDVDLVAVLEERHVDRLARRLKGEYYLDAGALRAAIAGRTCCNLIHLPTMMKIDLFIQGERPFDREAFDRIHWDTLDEREESPRLPFTTAEDMILHKLDWFRRGGQVSERQWGDVLGMIKVQGGSLDRVYLRRWAGELGLSGLLEAAESEAGPGIPG